jgi:hypothetical protein
MGLLDNVSRLGAALGASVEGLNPPKRPLPCVYKAPGRSPLCWSIFFLASSSCALLRFSFAIYPFPLISMASTCSQPITHSYPHASIVESGFQFSKPPPSDASIFGCAARFNLSAMDVPASMNGRRFQAPPAVGQPLPPACAAELSEDGEIFDSDDDDLPEWMYQRALVGYEKALRPETIPALKTVSNRTRKPRNSTSLKPPEFARSSTF